MKDSFQARYWTDQEVEDGDDIDEAIYFHLQDNYTQVGVRWFGNPYKAETGIVLVDMLTEKRVDPDELRSGESLLLRPTGKALDEFDEILDELDSPVEPAWITYEYKD